MFWELFLPQLIVTLIGLCLSIPITLFATFLGVLGALLLDRRQENLKRLDEEQEVIKRKAIILLAIREELEINVSELTGYKAYLEDEARIGTTFKLIRDETWQAFKSGGELEWIKDPILLNHLAKVYFFIKYTNHLSEKTFEIGLLSLRIKSVSSEGQLKILIRHIDGVLEEIDKLLKLI